MFLCVWKKGESLSTLGLLDVFFKLVKSVNKEGNILQYTTVCLTK